MSAKTVFVSIAVLEIYIWLGAFLFYAVEFHDLKNEDTMSHTEVNGTDLLAKLEKLIESKDFYKVEEIFEHLEYVLQNYSIAVKEHTLSTTEAIIACHSLAASVVSTIGYGNIVPKTPMGKVMVFLYSVLGIPLCLIGLTKVGGRLCRNTTHISSKIFKLLKRKPTFITGRLVALFFAMNICLVVWVILPSFVYSFLEDWSYLNSLYHTIVTVTTIGFGDFVPKFASGNLSYGTGVLIFYIPFRNFVVVGGLAWLATIVTITKEIIEHVFHTDIEDER